MTPAVMQRPAADTAATAATEEGTRWADDITALVRDLQAMSARVRELGKVPANVSADDLARVWRLLAGNTVPTGAAGVPASVWLAANWSQLGTQLAAGLNGTLLELSGRLQASQGTGLFPVSDFGNGVVTFINSDGCMPLGLRSSEFGHYAVGYVNNLRPDHPLRVALPNENDYYWLESAAADGRRFCYLLGGIIQTSAGPRTPDALSVADVARWTAQAARRKAELRFESAQAKQGRVLTMQAEELRRQRQMAAKLAGGVW